MTQPIRFARLRGSETNRLHKVKWHPSRYGGGWETRCGWWAARDDYWEFNPLGAEDCKRCAGEGDERSIEWDSW